MRTYNICFREEIINMFICISFKTDEIWPLAIPNQGPVVQSIVSLTSSLRVISLTVLADSIYNILIFFAEKM